MTTDRARAVADAVLYEGYVLYPYGARAGKNRVRFQWGVVGPVGAREAGAGEGASMQTECLLEARAGATLDVTVRFLQMQARRAERAEPGPEGAEFIPVEELAVADERWLTWDESVEREAGVTGLAVEELLDAPRELPIDVPGGEDVEEVRDGDGAVAGRLVRARWPLAGTLHVSAARVEPEGGAVDGDLVRVRVRLDNAATWSGGGDRTAALRRSFVSAHTLLHVAGGAFVSLMDPPEPVRAAAEACRNERAWPVLTGERGARDTVLSSPIILYDYPELAPESPGELFDSTEIDELLTLRIMTLTDEEKAQARATDARAAELVDRANSMPREIFERLHGAIRYLRGPSQENASVELVSTPDEPAWPTLRTPADDADRGGSEHPPGAPTDETFATDAPWWDPAVDARVDPDTDEVRVGDVAIAQGSRVRLRPSRRADAQDLFLAGRTATVAGVYFDVDGSTHVAVTVDDDPGADLHQEYGRFYYFGPGEVEPLEAQA